MGNACPSCQQCETCTCKEGKSFCDVSTSTWNGTHCVSANNNKGIHVSDTVMYMHANDVLETSDSAIVCLPRTRTQLPNDQQSMHISSDIELTMNYADMLEFYPDHPSMPMYTHKQWSCLQTFKENDPTLEVCETDANACGITVKPDGSCDITRFQGDINNIRIMDESTTNYPIPNLMKSQAFATAPSQAFPSAPPIEL